MSNLTSEMELLEGSSDPILRKIHPWRVCPAGKHFVIEHILHTSPIKENPEGMAVIRHLNSNLIKALIATESSFRRDAKNGIAHGLMQVQEDTLKILSDHHGELKDHIIEVRQKDLHDPSINICCGIRWLFRKKETASDKLHRSATWFEAIADYKGYFKK